MKRSENSERFFDMNNNLYYLWGWLCKPENGNFKFILFNTCKGK